MDLPIHKADERSGDQELPGLAQADRSGSHDNGPPTGNLQHDWQHD
jgi:hypothetical protein